MLYKNCRELLYHNFNEVQIHGDLTCLINFKEGNTVNFCPWYSDNELKRHWIDILEEYFALTNSFEHKKFFRDKAELNYLEYKLCTLKHLEPLSQIEITIEQKEKLDEILKKYQVSNITQSILGANDSINLKINRFNISYDKENKGNFEKTLAIMRMNGCQVNRNEVTVSEWVALLNQMKKQASSSNGRKKAVG